MHVCVRRHQHAPTNRGVATRRDPEIQLVILGARRRDPVGADVPDRAMTVARMLTRSRSSDERLGKIGEAAQYERAGPFADRAAVEHVPPAAFGHDDVAVADGDADVLHGFRERLGGMERRLMSPNGRSASGSDNSSVDRVGDIPLGALGRHARLRGSSVRRRPRVVFAHTPAGCGACQLSSQGGHGRTGPPRACQ
jgi:hypothetical protein